MARVCNAADRGQRREASFLCQPRPIDEAPARDVEHVIRNADTDVYRALSAPHRPWVHPRRLCVVTIG